MSAVWVLLGAGAGAAAGVTLWLRARTGAYRRPEDLPRANLGRSWAIVPMAGAGGAVAGLLEGPLAVVAWLYLVIGALLVWIDLDVHRIPDATLARWAPVLLLAVTVTAAFTTWTTLWWALAAAAALGVLYLLLALFGSMGLGDVKLAAVTGLVVGPLGLGATITAVFASFVFAAIAGVAMMVRGAGRRAHLAFGPAIVAGAAVAIARVGLGI